jgi:hypothetical protein
MRVEALQGARVILDEIAHAVDLRHGVLRFVNVAQRRAARKLDGFLDLCELCGLLRAQLLQLLELLVDHALTLCEHEQLRRDQLGVDLDLLVLLVICLAPLLHSSIAM